MEHALKKTLFFVFFSSPLWANFSYDLFLKGQFTDAFENPNAPPAHNTSEANDTSPQRAFAFHEVRGQFAWEDTYSKLSLELRPDRIQTDLAHDSRAGSVYRVHQPENFLSQISLQIHQHRFVAIRFERVRRLLDDSWIFADDMEFGLNVIFPERFQSLALDIQPLRDEIILKHAELLFFTGEDDDASTMVSKSKTHDAALGTKDAYTGSAVRLYGTLTNLSRFFVLVGKNRRTSIKSDETFLAARLLHSLELSGGKVFHELEYRRSFENYLDLDPSLTQESLGLKFKFEILDLFSPIAGYSWGKSERLSEDQMKFKTFGREFLLGAEKTVSPHFLYRLSVVEERRMTHDVDGYKKSGFRSENDERNYIRRFSFSLNYQWGS